MGKKRIMPIVMAMIVTLLPVMQLHAKEEFDGMVSGGKKQGTGTLYQEDGGWIEGFWIDDVVQGSAVVYNSETGGARYFFHDGAASGPVVGYIDEQEDMIISNDERNGLCAIIDRDGTVAQAAVMEKGKIQTDELVSWTSGDTTYYAAGRNSIEDGTAIAVYSNKNIYIGQFKDKKYEGKGVYYYADGRWYDGTWENGLLEGESIFYYSASDSSKPYDVYMKGNYTNSVLDGVGVIYRSDRSRFVCRMKDGRADGIGITVNENGETIFSEWKDGKNVRDNITPWKADNGVSYIGKKAGKTVDGYGACIYEKGMISVGDFTKGVHDGEAYIYWPDTDSYFDGHYENGKFSGDGAVYYRNGNYFKGVYSNGEWEEGIYYYYGEGWFDGTFKSGQVETGNMNRILDDGTITVEKYRDGKKL